MLSLRVASLSLGLLYAVTTHISQWDYAQGMKQHAVGPFDDAARLFPWHRTQRTAPAYAAILYGAPAPVQFPRIEAALKTDPYAADLWFNLARLALKMNDVPRYTLAENRLRRLVPGIAFHIVKGAAP